MKLFEIKIIITVILFFNLIHPCRLYSQQIKDTIITDIDTIPCTITYVNSYSIFYKINENNNIKARILPRLYVEKLIINSKNVPILEQKYDSYINGFYKKSKLDKKYDALLLKENSSNNLKILADSTFTFKKNDYFKIATSVELFAKKYNCKLIYVSEPVRNNYNSINVKLYDATDAYYQELLDLYKQNTISFFRGNNALEPEEIKLKHNDTIIWVKKNEILEFKINAVDSVNFKNDPVLIKGICQNKYFFVGDISHYKFTLNVMASLFVSVTLSSITDSYIFIGISNNLTKTSNFIGEFMKVLTKSKYSN